MTKAQLRDFCKKPLKKGKRGRSRNPHLTSGRWRYLGMFMKTDVPQVKRIFRIHGIANKITKDHLKHNARLREIYVRREQWDTAYRAVTRLFEGGQAA